MRVKIRDIEFKCSVAKTPHEHALGLSKHADLGANEGMLFVFPRASTHTFHMSTCKMPLDILGIDEFSKISKIVDDTKPGTLERWTFPKVSAVLEVPGGSCRRAKLRIGDEVLAFDVMTLRGQLGPQETQDPAATDPANPAVNEALEESPEPPVTEIGEGQRFRVGRYGPAWIVIKVDGSTGFVQREGHKRKWFGFSHNKETGEVAVYPVVQGSGIRSGDPIAFGPMRLDDGVAYQEAQRTVASRTATHPNSHDPIYMENDHTDEDHLDQWRDTQIPADRFESSTFHDEPKEEYFHELWPDELADQALEPHIFSPVTRHGRKEAAAPTHVQVDMIDDQTLGQMLEMEIESAGEGDCESTWNGYEIPESLRSAADEFARMFNGVLNYWLAKHWPPKGNPGASSAYQYKMSHGPEKLLHDQMESAAYYAYLDMGGAGTGLWDNWEHIFDKSEIKDLQNTVETHPAMIKAFSHLETEFHNWAYTFSECEGEDPDDDGGDDDDEGNKPVAPFQPRVNTQDEPPRMQASRRAQIVDEPRFVEKVANILLGKTEEMQWAPDVLNGGATERCVVTRTELSRWLGGQAKDEALRYIITAASDDRGMNLIGDAFVLAGLADEARLGFKGRAPTLVLYRENQAQA